MSDLFRAVRAEIFKLRRTLALWASVLVPIAVIVMTTAMNLSRAPGTRFDPDQPNGWDSLMLDLVLLLWCLIALPMFAALETALLAGIEHDENKWRHLFALPIQRGTIYVAKLLVSLGLVCVSSLVLVIGTALEGWILVVFRPDFGVAQTIPWSLIFARAFVFVPAALLMLSVQLWVATRWRSFTVAMSLGLGCTIVGIMLLRTLKNAGSVPHGPLLASLFPWSLPYVLIAHHATESLRENALVVGVFGGMFFSILSCWEILRRDVL